MQHWRGERRSCALTVAVPALPLQQRRPTVCVTDRARARLCDVILGNSCRRRLDAAAAEFGGRDVVVTSRT